MMAKLAALTWFEFRLYLKNTQTVFWTFAFPVILVGLLVAIFDAGHPGPHGLDSYRFYGVTGLVSITIVTNALFGFGTAWSEARSRGAYVPYHWAPIGTLQTGWALMASRAFVLGALPRFICPLVSMCSISRCHFPPPFWCKRASR